MKKLFIITDVSLTDARYYLRDRMIGTVVRAELVDDQNKIGNDFLYIRESGTALGTTFQDMSLWDSNPEKKFAFHASITLKPLQ